MAQKRMSIVKQKEKIFKHVESNLNFYKNNVMDRKKTGQTSNINSCYFLATLCIAVFPNFL